MKRTRAALAYALLSATMFAPLPVLADNSTATAISKGVMFPVDAELQAQLQEPLQEVAQANPVGTKQNPLRTPGLPLGFTFNLDFSFSYPFGNLGYQNAKLPGGMDAGFGYGFTRENRLQVGYYEIPQFPVGFSNKTVPFFVQGFTGPGTIPQTYQSTGNANPTTKDKFFVLVDQNLINIAGKFPIVISPTYLAHWGFVGNNGTDVQTIEFDGFPTTVHLRTEQEWFIPLTVPFLSSPRFFGTATVAAQWLGHPAGVNQTNHAQIFELAYLEYRAAKDTSFFFQPSRLIQYNPSDPYPQYTPTFIYGLSHHFTKLLYTQIYVATGGPSNYTQLGITSLTCQRLPCNAPGNTIPSLAGLKATTIQLQFGIGSPTVIPL
jgi:hypothetical protein